MDKEKRTTEERKEELIKEIESNFDFGLRDAIHYHCTFNSLMNSIFEDWAFSDSDDAQSWLEDHYDDFVDYIKEGHLNDCPAFWEIVNYVYKELARDEFMFYEDRIQELLDLNWLNWDKRDSWDKDEEDN